MDVAQFQVPVVVDFDKCDERRGGARECGYRGGAEDGMRRSVRED